MTTIVVIANYKIYNTHEKQMYEIEPIYFKNTEDVEQCILISQIASTSFHFPDFQLTYLSLSFFKFLFVSHESKNNLLPQN